MAYLEDESKQIIPDQQQEDPFVGLLNLEDNFYREGHSEGASDGAQAGLLEGRAFGLQKGFEKYLAMGRLHGRAVVWAGRLQKHQKFLPEGTAASNGESNRQEAGIAHSQLSFPQHPHLRDLPENPRLEKHIMTLFALTEPATLSTQNTEDSVSDFDDRLKRALAKVKIIEKLIGESQFGRADCSGEREKGGDDGNIEDVSTLRVRM
ncbi:hypothetical protein GP486_001946 [Trichoglossum hirsutum]|uniref:Essential protein Yae1 N-terminal domain-containing protein n=1 Tax=Trichoglossum hirsutum TaxID=265104 RepID=A0A9P8LFV5_9PEZI|nr:hypothetical protein GP486_001946 [Trichoglossum hirsutum]